MDFSAGPIVPWYPEAISKASEHLLQSRILALRLDEDWHVGVGVFPEGEEVLVGLAGLRGVAAQRRSTPEAEVGERIQDVHAADATVVDDLLELRSGLSTRTSLEVSLPAQVDAEVVRALVGCGRAQVLDRFGGCAAA